MTFQDALKKLGIEDYSERIMNSNSHGEMIHLYDYIMLAEKEIFSLDTFRIWFEMAVKYAEQHWTRPESVFQHMPKMILELQKAMSSELYPEESKT